MCKIGLVTIYSKNYGSVLQCYATKKYLHNLGVNCDVLYHKFDKKDRFFYWIRKGLMVLSNSVKYKGFFKYFVEDTKAQHKSINSLSKESEMLLDSFTRDVLKPIGYTNAQAKRASLDGEYRYFLAGADQVWNGARLIDPFMFLAFCDNNKKISLSPSIGVNRIANFNRKEFKKRIEIFHRLSAREFSGQEEISELTGKRCERTADPVLLLKPTEWSTFGEQSHIAVKQQFVFVHFLDKPSELTISIINYIANNKGLKIICFAYPHVEYEKLDNFEFIDGSPYDYIHLIDKANFICTDSFHTTQFSIIFDKDFYIFERNYTHRNSQQSRLDTLTEIYSCRNRYISSDFNALKYIDLENKDTYRSKVNDEHDAIVRYIKSALKIDKRNIIYDE